MIYVDMNGRCGNQLFQYAFARKLSMLNDDMPITIDFWNVARVGRELSDNSFVDNLKDFNVKEYNGRFEKDHYLDEYGTFFQKKIWVFCKKQQALNIKLKLGLDQNNFFIKAQKYGVYREENLLMHPQKCLSKDIFIRGYFERADYYIGMEEVLRKEFAPKTSPNKANDKLYKIINNNESVCVSFRKWDGDDSFRAICNKEYYLKAMEIIHSAYPNALFVLFSDDIEWAKNNFSCPYNCVYESGNDEVYEKLRLMYNCKHFIITNSTFAWWAQYLGTNENKMVIAPSRWSNVTSNYYLKMSNWTLLDV